MRTGLPEWAIFAEFKSKAISKKTKDKQEWLKLKDSYSNFKKKMIKNWYSYRHAYGCLAMMENEHVYWVKMSFFRQLIWRMLLDQNIVYFCKMIWNTHLIYILINAALRYFWSTPSVSPLARAAKLELRPATQTRSIANLNAAGRAVVFPYRVVIYSCYLSWPLLINMLFQRCHHCPILNDLNNLLGFSFILSYDGTLYRAFF